VPFTVVGPESLRTAARALADQLQAAADEPVPPAAS
jgi:hypothetical protein